MKYSLYLFVLMMVACGDPAPSPAPQQVERVGPTDRSRVFPREDRTAMELVIDNILGKDFLPGGNLATYEKGGKTYRMFLVVTKDNDAAGFLAMDVKDQLVDAKFVPSFGGYFGLDGDTPWFIFPKTNHLLGVVGLPQDEADAVAREFAARVR
jgi:hypothetical protein